LYKLCLILGTIFSITFIEATELDDIQTIEKWIPMDSIESEITEYLDANDLTPYIPNGWVCDRFEFLEPNVEYVDGFGVFVEVQSLQENSEERAVFFLYKSKATEEIFTRLIYITNTQPISMQLYYDIMRCCFLNTSNFDNSELLKDRTARIYIVSNPEENDEIEQIWTFFTPEKKCEIPILLSDDGDGGTVFQVKEL